MITYKEEEMFTANEIKVYKIEKLIAKKYFLRWNNYHKYLINDNTIEAV